MTNRKILFHSADINDSLGDIIPVVAVSNGDGSYSLSVSNPYLVSQVQFTGGSSGSAAAYAASDVVSSGSAAPLLEFPNVVNVEGGSGYIVKARLLTDLSSCVAQFRLHLYADNSPAIIADNAALAVKYANRLVRLGYIDFPALVTEGTGSDMAFAIISPGTGNLPIFFKCAGGSKSLYAILETKSIFTPGTGQNFFLELTISFNA